MPFWAERPVRPRVRVRLFARGCRGPSVRSSQHGRPVGAGFRWFPRSGGGSSRFSSDGYGGGDASGTGGEAVPVRGGRRGGSARAPREWTLLAGLASGGHPSCVTQGQPQSGPGGKRASAPQPPSPRPHCWFLAAPCLGYLWHLAQPSRLRSRPSLEPSAASPSSLAGVSYLLVSSFPRGSGAGAGLPGSGTGPARPLGRCLGGGRRPRCGRGDLTERRGCEPLPLGQVGVADRTQTTHGCRGPSSPTSLSLKKSYQYRG